MSRVVLLRHAATDWSGVRFCGRTDLPLNDVGKRQVAELIERVAEAHLVVHAVRSSPALRAAETAAPLARALGARLDLDDRLREVDLGLAEGRTFDEVARAWPAIARALLSAEDAIDWPDGERAVDVVERLRPVAEELDRSDGDALFVTHGGTIRALGALLGLESAAATDLPPAHALVLEGAPRWHAVGAIAAPR